MLLIWIEITHKNNTLFLFGGESDQEYLNIYVHDPNAFC